MAVCSACGKKVSELMSDNCLGHACKRRVCFDCSAETNRLCPECDILDEIDQEQFSYSRHNNEDKIAALYDELASVKVYTEKDLEEREMEEEAEKDQEEEKDTWWFDEID
jgi:hypothetical protein